MSGIAKVFVILNLVFSLLILGAAAAYLSKADQWKKEYDAIKVGFDEKEQAWEKERTDLIASNRNLKEENDAKQGSIEDLNLEVAGLNNQLKSEQVDNQQLRDDVTKIYSKLEMFQTNMNDLTARNNELVDMNTELRSTTRDAEESMREAKKDLLSVQSELDSALEQIQSLEGQITELTQNNEKLSNLVQTASRQGFDASSTVAMPEIPATVEEVNNELGFVILNVGADDKVEEGYTFQVYRGDRYLGEVQVDDVYPDRCAARIKFQVDGAQFQVNDQATTML